MKGVTEGETEGGEETKVTVYEKEGAVLSDSRFVLRETRVVAPVPRFDSVNGQNAQLLAVSRDHDTVARAQVLLGLVQIIENRPPNANRLVAFRNGACSRNSFVEIHFFIAERERRDCR